MKFLIWYICDRSSYFKSVGLNLESKNKISKTSDKTYVSVGNSYAYCDGLWDIR
jgi:hypothetical protein